MSAKNPNDRKVKPAIVVQTHIREKEYTRGQVFKMRFYIGGEIDDDGNPAHWYGADKLFLQVTATTSYNDHTRIWYGFNADLLKSKKLSVEPWDDKITLEAAQSYVTALKPLARRAEREKPNTFRDWLDTIKRQYHCEYFWKHTDERHPVTGEHLAQNWDVYDEVRALDMELRSAILQMMNSAEGEEVKQALAERALWV